MGAFQRWNNAFNTRQNKESVQTFLVCNRFILDAVSYTHLKQVLEKEKARHAALVAQLSDKLSNQKKEAERLAQDEKRLGEMCIRDRFLHALDECQP